MAAHTMAPYLVGPSATMLLTVQDKWDIIVQEWGVQISAPLQQKTNKIIQFTDII